MCEFCVQHGNGKKWYLEASNYGQDLAADLRRQGFARDFFANYREDFQRGLQQLELLARAPAPLRRAVTGLFTWHMKPRHFGQVVPLEDVERILPLVNSVVRLPCVCRRITVGQEEARYCIGLTVDPHRILMAGILDDSFRAGPDTMEFETLTRDGALALMRDFERDGLVHSVWTMVTPFVAGICNCDRADCLAMLSTVKYDAKVMWRGEYVAAVAEERCTGCRRCMRLCQFGALAYSAAEGHVVVDQYRCYGCGVCRTGCEAGALRLLERQAVPAVARLW